MMFKKLLIVVLSTVVFIGIANAQTSWKDAQKTKKAEIKVYHVDATPFIFKENNETKGLEADIMREFVRFVKKTYQVECELTFHYREDFGELYQLVKGGYSGTFGASSFSITEERKKEIQFSPAYMPDIEILISSPGLPIIKDTSELATAFKSVTAIRMPRTTFANDLKQLERLIPYMKYEDVTRYSDISPKVANNKKYISYVQLATYFLSIKDGLSLKRQNLFKKEKLGRGIVFPLESDWKTPIEAFFNSRDFKPWVNARIKQYFGDEVNDLIWQVANTDSQNNQNVLLLTKEKELKDLEVAKKELEIKRQTLIRNIFIVAVLGVFLIAFFIYNRYQLQQRNNKVLQNKNDEILSQKNELVSKNEELQLQQEEILSQQSYIEKKNLELERKHKDVEKSIQAAQVIQRALLPYQERMEEHLRDYFIIYRPKDIVSGDFYWLQQRDDKIFVAAVDCTGHGVPGAMMAMIGYMILDKLVMVDKLNDPAEILNHCHSEVLDLLEGNSNSGNYGMDLAFLVMESVNEAQYKLTFAGAKRSLLYIPAEGQSIQEAQGTRRSIGGFHRYTFQFGNQEVTLKKGSMIYLATDGFADQNNSSRKKYGKQRFKDLLRTIGKLPLPEQKTALENELDEHMFGTTQRDDVLVMGFKL